MALRGTTWGCCREDLRTLFVTYIRSVAEYCASAWMPATKEANRNRIEVMNNRSARLIAGCTNSTPIEPLLVEADLLPFSTRAKQLNAMAYERSLRLPNDNPRR